MNQSLRYTILLLFFIYILCKYRKKNERSASNESSLPKRNENRITTGKIGFLIRYISYCTHSNLLSSQCWITWSMEYMKHDDVTRYVSIGEGAALQHWMGNKHWICEKIWFKKINTKISAWILSRKKKYHFLCFNLF